MAYDGVAVTEGSGETVATDLIATKQYQRVKVAWGAEGTANEVAAATPLPVGDASALTQLQAIVAALASVAVTGPLTDAQLRASPILTSLATLPDTAAGDLAAIAAALGGTLAVDQSAVTTALGNLLAELQAKADLAETQPVSAASLPLPTGASTAANQTTMIGHVDGIEGLLTTMDSDTSALAAFVAAKTLTTQATTEADSGDNTVVAGPGAGTRIVVSSIVVQNESATATTILLKDGATTKRRALLQAQGDGVAWQFPPGREWKLGDNAALVVNLSGANSHGVTVDYYTEAV